MLLVMEPAETLRRAQGFEGLRGFPKGPSIIMVYTYLVFLGSKYILIGYFGGLNIYHNDAWTLWASAQTSATAGLAVLCNLPTKKMCEECPV